MKWSSSLWYIPLDAGWIAIGIFLLFSGNFAYYFNLIVSASEHLIPKLSDYQILAAKVQAVYSRTLSNQRFDFELCVASGAFLLLSFQLLAFHWIQVSPQFHIVFMLSKSACYWHFFSKYWMQAAASGFIIQIDPMKSSSPNIWTFLKSSCSRMQYLLLSCICSVCKQCILHLVSTA